MHPFKLYSRHLAIVGMLFGTMSLFANQEDDLLDPSLDQPLPQYEQTGGAGFSEAPPVATPPSRTQETTETQLPPKSAAPKFGTGTELAPNPLASLLSKEDDQQSPPDGPLIETTPGSIDPESNSPARIDTKRPEPALPEVEPKRIEKVPAREPAPIAYEKTPMPVIKRPSEPKLSPASPGIPLPEPFKILPDRTPPPSIQSPRIQSPPRPPVRLMPAREPTKEPVVREPVRTSRPKPPVATKKETSRQPVLNFDIYRDTSQYPMDPRKPNNPCTNDPNCGCGCQHVSKYGAKGQPFQPREPGGETCGKRCPNKRPQFSAYWPRPLSAKLDEHNSERAAARYSGCQEKKLVDVFDRLVNFRLVDYHRTDNGYVGPEADPYGCLGESMHFGGVYQIPTSVEPHVMSYPLQ